MIYLYSKNQNEKIEYVLWSMSEVVVKFKILK